MLTAASITGEATEYDHSNDKMGSMIERARLGRISVHLPNFDINVDRFRRALRVAKVLPVTVCQSSCVVLGLQVELKRHETAWS